MKKLLGIMVLSLVWCNVGFAEDKFENQDIFAPWNDTLMQNDIFAPWNDTLMKDDIFAPWNNIRCSRYYL